MNGKQAKFLKRYCQEMGLDYLRLKADWAKIPRPSRAFMLAEMYQAVQSKHEG